MKTKILADFLICISVPLFKALITITKDKALLHFIIRNMKLSARIHDNGFAKENFKFQNILTLTIQRLESWPALLGFAVIV